MKTLLCIILLPAVAEAQWSTNFSCVNDADYILSHPVECTSFISPAPDPGEPSPAPSVTQSYSQSLIQAQIEMISALSECRHAFATCNEAYDAERKLRLKYQKQCKKRR